MTSEAKDKEHLDEHGDEDTQSSQIQIESFSDSPSSSALAVTDPVNLKDDDEVGSNRVAMGLSENQNASLADDLREKRRYESDNENDDAEAVDDQVEIAQTSSDQSVARNKNAEQVESADEDLEEESGSKIDESSRRKKRTEDYVLDEDDLELLRQNQSIIDTSSTRTRKRFRKIIDDEENGASASKSGDKAISHAEKAESDSDNDSDDDDDEGIADEAEDDDQVAREAAEELSWLNKDIDESGIDTTGSGRGRRKRASHQDHLSTIEASAEDGRDSKKEEDGSAKPTSSTKDSSSKSKSKVEELDDFLDDDEDDDELDSSNKAARRHRRRREDDDLDSLDEYDSADPNRNMYFQAMRIFGDDYVNYLSKPADEEEEEQEEYDEEDEYDDPDLDEDERRVIREGRIAQRNARKKTKVKSLQELFEPAILEEKFLLDRDEAIRVTDEPERFQLRAEPVKPCSDSELEQEATWIHSQIFGSSSSIDYSQNQSSALEEIRTRKICSVLDLIRNQKYEIPFIAAYRKEYFEMELKEDVLWRIYEHDMQWMAIQSKKTRLLAQLEGLQNYFVDLQYPKASRYSQQEESKLPGDTIEPESGFASSLSTSEIEEYSTACSRINTLASIAQSLRELEDCEEFVTLHFSPALAAIREQKASQQTGIDPSNSASVNGFHNKPKQPRKKSHFHQARAQGIFGLLRSFALHPEKLSGNLTVFFQEHEPPSRASDSPEEASDQTAQGHAPFATGEHVLKGMRMVASVEISTDPAIRHFVRQHFLQVATISVRPTHLGMESIDESHVYAPFKFITRKPFSAFKDEQFALILRAEREGFVKVLVDIPRESSLAHRSSGSDSGNGSSSTSNASSRVVANLSAKDAVETTKLYSQFLDAYLENSHTLRAEQWNEQRRLIIQGALGVFLFPHMEKELRALLEDRALRYLRNQISQSFRSKILVGPYPRTQRFVRRAAHGSSKGSSSHDDSNYEDLLKGDYGGGDDDDDDNDDEDDYYDNDGRRRGKSNKKKGGSSNNLAWLEDSDSESESRSKRRGGRKKAQSASKKSSTLVEEDLPVGEKHARILGFTIGSKDFPSFAAMINGNGEVMDYIRLKHFHNRVPRNNHGDEDFNAPETRSREEDLDKIKAMIKEKRPHALALAIEPEDYRRSSDLLNRCLRDISTDEFPFVKSIEVQLVDPAVSKLKELSTRFKAEFPDYPPLLLRAVSVARQLQDPLTEYASLVLDGASFVGGQSGLLSCGGGMRLDDVAVDDGLGSLQIHPLQSLIPPNVLRTAFLEPLISAVNFIGVDLNRALFYPHTSPLLQFICGLGPRKVDLILREIKKKGGKLKSRAELIHKGLVGAKVFQNCSGFLFVNGHAAKSYDDDDDNEDYEGYDEEFGNGNRGDEEYYEEVEEEEEEEVEEEEDEEEEEEVNEEQESNAKDKTIPLSLESKENSEEQQSQKGDVQPEKDMPAQAIDESGDLSSTSTNTLEEKASADSAITQSASSEKSAPAVPAPKKKKKRIVVKKTKRLVKKPRRFKAYIDILDRTRVHPESYELARKIARDALDSTVIDERDPSIHVVEISKMPEKLNEVDLDHYARHMEESGATTHRIRTTLYDIRNELFNLRDESLLSISKKESKKSHHSHHSSSSSSSSVTYNGAPVIPDSMERRAMYRPLSESDLFTLVTGETDTSMFEGMMIECPVIAVSKDFVRVRVTNSITGSVHISKISDSQVADINDFVRVGMIIHCRVLRLKKDRMSAELTCRSSDLSNQNLTFRLPRDTYFDFEEEAKERERLQLAGSKKSKKTYIKRNIAHRRFKNISLKGAIRELASAHSGEAIVRPSSKGADHLVISWKLDDNCIQHIDVLELDKPDTQKLGRRLQIGSETFDDLDEILTLHVGRMYQLVRDLKLDKNFVAGGSKQEVDAAVTEEKKANPSKIPYKMTLLMDKPGRCLLSYQPASRPHHDYFEITGNGFLFHGALFNTTMDLIKNFKARYAESLRRSKMPLSVPTSSAATATAASPAIPITERSFPRARGPAQGPPPSAYYQQPRHPPAAAAAPIAASGPMPVGYPPAGGGYYPQAPVATYLGHPQHHHQVPKQPPPHPHSQPMQPQSPYYPPPQSSGGYYPSAAAQPHSYYVPPPLPPGAPGGAYRVPPPPSPHQPASMPPPPPPPHHYSSSSYPRNYDDREPYSSSRSYSNSSSSNYYDRNSSSSSSRHAADQRGSRR